MALGTPYITDTDAVMVGDVCVNMPAATQATAYGLANVDTALVSFNFIYGNQIVSFVAGQPFKFDAGLQAALIAAGAPILIGSLTETLNFSYPINSGNILALFGG